MSAECRVCARDVTVSLVCVCGVKLKFDQCAVCDSVESESMKDMIYPLEKMRHKLQELVTKAQQVSPSHCAPSHTHAHMHAHVHT